MAILAFMNFQSHVPMIRDRVLTWSALPQAPVAMMPQLFWSGGRPWREANVWLRSRLFDGVKVVSLVSSGEALLAYANWLEGNATDWLDFPLLKRERCLVKYRGALVLRRDAGTLASSTASNRMRAVIQFYRWCIEAKAVVLERAPWTDRKSTLLLTSAKGVLRTFSVKTTDLAIPAKQRGRPGLEGGVEPLNTDQRDRLLALALRLCTPELYLMLALSFFTGLRLGSITDLKVATLENATLEPLTSELMHLHVGPSANPPVATKYNVSGSVLIPTELLDILLSYSKGARRLRRQQKAGESDKDLLFVTSHGRRYILANGDHSRGINVQLHRFRNAAREIEPWLHSFKFHQARATFATAASIEALKHLDSLSALALVRDLMLHKDEATTLRYIRYVEAQEVKIALASGYTKIILSRVAFPTGPA